MIYVIVGIENTLAFLNCTENIFLGTAVVMLPAHSSLSGADLVNIYILLQFLVSPEEKEPAFSLPSWFSVSLILFLLLC